MDKKIILFSFLIISAFLLTGFACALEDTEIVIESDSDWISAGGASATISVSLINSSCTITNVEFRCTEAEKFGDVSQKTVSSSPFITYFSSTLSGTANIEAIVSYNDSEGNTGTITKNINQKIDHTVPHEILSVNYLNEVTVNENTPVTVIMADRYGNLIDSRYEEENSTSPEFIEMYSSPQDSLFFDGADYTLNYTKVYVNSSGAASALLRVSKVPGNNEISLYPPNGIEPQYRTIMGLGNAWPFSIIASVSPNNGQTPYLPADEESKFYINYYLFDQYGNPAGNRTIHIESSNVNDADFYRTSNMDNGVVSISYGPTSQKSVITLVAYSVDNESVYVEQRIMFDSTEPVDMILTANPEVMPSYDVSSDRTSAVRAKVIDERGNPVANETVSFSIVDGSYPSYSTSSPYLSEPSALTNEDGYAIIDFIPGSFIYDTNDPLYELQASANCTVRAVWENMEGVSTERDIILEWKNFPYLSVESEVTPETVSVNDTVDVTVRLIGDGWALQPDPIDVVLSADRSGSMLKDYPDRMVVVMDAMKEFTSSMSEKRDRIGLTTFGNKGWSDIWNYGMFYWAGYDGYSWYISKEDITYISQNYPNNGTDYSDYATLDIGLTPDYSNVYDTISGIVPMQGTPMRGGIYLALKELIENGKEDAVRAVVVLSDGDYNYYGDPLARGSGFTSYPSDFGDLTKNYYRFSDLSYDNQNLAKYAKSNNIKIYSIAFGNDLSYEGRRTLRLLAEESEGEFFDDVDSSNINDVYREIAGDLKTEAGVNTQMNLDFTNVELNNITVPNTQFEPVLEYVYANDRSTVISKWNRTEIVIPRYTVDDRDEWSANRSLDFDVGTVRLGETWETTFRLRALKDGNINIFGPGSTIKFNNGTDELSLPKTFITAVHNQTSTGIDFKDLSISDLRSTNTATVTDALDLKWNINYTGEYSAEQNVYYLRQGDDVWILFETMSPVFGPVEEKEQSAVFVVKDMPPGTYSIRVHAKSPDTADAISEIDSCLKIGDSEVSYIKIE